MDGVRTDEGYSRVDKRDEGSLSSAAMSWISSRGFVPKPIVIVDDDLGDLEKALEVISSEAPELLSQMTVVGLPVQSGSDSLGFVLRWLEAYPGLQVVASLKSEQVQTVAGRFPDRFQGLPLRQDTTALKFSESIAELIRAGGFYLQDIQLESLPFVPEPEPWQSVYILTNQVRALFPVNPPQFWLMSNKRAYPATFVLDLEKRGFNPRRVVEKDYFSRDLRSHLKSFSDENMPLALHLKEDGLENATTILVGSGDRDQIFSSLDLIFWQPASRLTFGGLKVKKEIAYRESNESKAWKALVADLFGDYAGVSKLQFGMWEAPDPEHQDRLEYAPKLAHKLRAKLQDGELLETIEGGAYRLSRSARVGWVRPFKFDG